MTAMKILLDIEKTDLEGSLLTIEGLCALREYVIVRSMLRALRDAKEKLDSEQALEALEYVLMEALQVAELEIERYGIYMSEPAVAISYETEFTIKHYLEQSKAIEKRETA